MLVMLLVALLPTAPCASAAQTTQIVGPMTVVMPSGWVRRQMDPISFYIAEVSATGQEESQIYFSSVDQAGATQASVHKVTWDQMLKQDSRPKRRSNGSFGRFIWSQMEVLNNGGRKNEYHRLYTTQVDTSYIMVLYSANSKNMFNKHVRTVEGMLANAGFRATPGSTASATPGNRALAQASPGASWLPAKDIPIVESHVHIDIRSNTLTSNVLTDHILFFQNGIVVREGVVSAPRSCYATIETADLATLPFNYGRWREDKSASKVFIQWQQGPPWTLKREGDRLSLEGKKLLKLRPLDGLKLDGTFVHRSLLGTNVTLTLRRDESFETGGLMEEMICGPPNRRPTLSGAGTYEVRKWTLILHFSSGALTLLPISVPSDEDLRAVSKFSLRSAYDFVKAR
jgi:hypothetical protein